MAAITTLATAALVMKRSSRQALFDALQKAEAAGLAPAQALALLPAQGSADHVLTLTALQKLLKQDIPLSEAARKSSLFEPHEVGLIRAGERLGRLVESYGWLARHYGQIDGRWTDLYTRLRLPLLVLLGTAVFLHLTALAGGRMGFGSYLLHAGVPAALLLYARSFHARYANRALPAWATELLLRLPVLRDHLRQYHEAVFCHHLGFGLEAGLSLPDAVSMAIDGVGNPRIRESFGTIGSGVAAGSTLATACSFSDAISRPDGSLVIGTAEATGTLPAALKDYARKLGNRNETGWDALLRRTGWAAWALVLLGLLA